MHACSLEVHWQAFVYIQTYYTDIQEHISKVLAAWWNLLLRKVPVSSERARTGNQLASDPLVCRSLWSTQRGPMANKTHTAELSRQVNKWPVIPLSLPLGRPGK